jgi:hypothetical protein
MLVLPTCCALGVGCAGMSYKYARVAKAGPEAAPSGGKADAPPPADPEGRLQSDEGVKRKRRAGSARSQGKRLVIYNAQVVLAVFEPERLIKRVRIIAEKAGGWMEQLDNHRVVMRVPAAKLRPLVTRISELGRVIRKNIRGRDVTAEFLDLEIRLKNAIAMRKRMLVLLQKATNVKDSVAIERELGRITAQIERFKGRLKYLRHNIAFSKLTVIARERRIYRGRRQYMPFDWVRQLGLPRLLSNTNR